MTFNRFIIQANNLNKVKYSMATILYQDKVVTLYDGLIVLHKYYFPLATSKTIILSDI